MAWRCAWPCSPPSCATCRLATWKPAGARVEGVNDQSHIDTTMPVARAPAGNTTVNCTIDGPARQQGAAARPHRGTVFVEYAMLISQQNYPGRQFVIRLQAPRCAA